MDSLSRLIDGLVKIYGSEGRLAEALGVEEEVVARFRNAPCLDCDIAGKFADVLAHIHRRKVGPCDDELPYTRAATPWERARSHVYQTGVADRGGSFSPSRVGAEF